MVKSECQKGGDSVTSKQRRFVQEYLIDLNATKAAIRAGYSPKTAQQMGSENLSKPVVQNAIADFMDNMTASNIADIQETMEYLTAVMRGEITEQALIFVGNGIQQITNKVPSAKDRIRAAELIGKRYGLFTDRVGVEGVIPVIITGDDQLED